MIVPPHIARSKIFTQKCVPGTFYFITTSRWQGSSDLDEIWHGGSFPCRQTILKNVANFFQTLPTLQGLEVGLFFVKAFL